MPERDAALQRERDEARKDADLLNDLWAAWPEIRQLIEGWATTTPADEWSEWDEKVRQITVQFSFRLESAHSGGIAPRTTRLDTERLDWLEARRLAFNRHYGTEYGWKFVTSPNINRLFVKDVNTIDLNDAEAKAGDIRVAIDAARQSGEDGKGDRNA